MKKFFFILFMLAFLPAVCNAGEDIIPLSFNISPTPGDDNGNGSNVLPRGPINYPSAAIEDHTLYLYDGCDNNTLRLKSTDGTVVFCTYVEEGTTSVVLPSTLTGTYELQIVCGGITFYAYIIL